MPGKIKVKVLAGRNLPVMDRSGDTTDAYVEIKFGNTTYKTDVCRKSLNPQWNSEWYRFEVDDAELQDEPLQLRLMDHDTYSANDAIGKVYLNLNPLLLPGLPPPVKNIWTLEASLTSSAGAQGGSVMTGWIPVFDTMHGIRGEVNVIVKVELFSDFNRFRDSSCGVQFYYSPNCPYGYHVQIIHGFVEELIVSDDPEYKWIDKIRTPRASNEARQTLFFKLSGEVQRRIGLKAVELGGNAVIGYVQNFDLEGESGIVARGIGTAVTLIKLQDAPLNDSQNIEDLSFFRSQSKNQLDCSESDDSLPLLSRSPSPYSRSPTNSHSSKFGSYFPTYEKNRNPHTTVKITDYQGSAMRRQLSLQNSPGGNLRRIGATSTQSLSEDLISESSLRTMLALEDMRGERTSAFSRGLKNLRYFPRKMMQIKSKLPDSLDEESDDSTYSSTWSVTGSESTRSSFSDFRHSIRRKKFTHKRNQPDGMAALLIRSVHAGFPLDSVLEDRETPTPSPVNFREKFELSDGTVNQKETGVSIEEIEETTEGENEEKIENSVSKKEDNFDYMKAHIPMISSSETDTSTSEDEDDDAPSESSTNYNILDDSFSMGFSSSVEKSELSMSHSKIDEAPDHPSLMMKIHSQSSDDKNSSTPSDADEKPSDFERALEKAKQNSFPEGMILDYDFASEDVLTPLLSSVSSASDNELLVMNCQVLDSPSPLKTSPSFKLKLLGKQKSFDASEEANTFADTTIIDEVKIEQVTSSINEVTQSSMHNESPSVNVAETLNDASSRQPQPETSIDVGEVPLIDLNVNIESPPPIKFHPEVVGVIRKEKPSLTPVIPIKLDSTRINDICADKTQSSPKSPIVKEIPPKINDNFENAKDDSTAPYKKYLFHSGSLEGKSHHEKKEKSSKKVSRTETVIYKGPPKIKPKNTEQPEIPKKDSKPLQKPEIIVGPAIIDNSHLKLPPQLPKDVSITTPYVADKNPPEFSLPQKYTIEAQLMSERFVKKYRHHCMLDLIHTIDARMMVHHMHSERKDSKKRHGHKHSNLTPSPESIHRTKSHRRCSKSPERHHHHHHTHHSHQITPHTSGHSSHSTYTPAPTPQLPKKILKSSQSSLENLSKHNQNDSFLPKDKLIPSAIIIENYDTHEIAASELTLKSMNNEISSEISMEMIPLNLIHSDNINKSQNLSPEHNDTSVHKSRSLDELPSNLAITNSTNIPKSTNDVCCVPCPSLVPRQQEEASSPVHPQVFPGSVGSKVSTTPGPKQPAMLHRRSSDSDLSITPKGNSLAGSDRSMGGHLRPSTAIVRTMNQDTLGMLEYPFITMQQYPSGFILNIGGLVSAKSVKLIERISNLEEPEGRDAWWTEIRMEVRSHARALGCNVVLGYKEEISICDDVCVLNASGTAAVINLMKSNQDQDVVVNKTSANNSMENDKEKGGQKNSTKTEELPVATSSGKVKRTSESNDHESSYASFQFSCSLCHLPYNETSVPFRVDISKCNICRRANVPDVLFTTIELPDNIPITGRGVLLQATVCKNKRDLRGELNAREISDCLPFLEYELHSLLLNKLKVKGMNAIFGLRVQVSIGERLVIGMAAGTAVFLTALPTPNVPQIACGNLWHNDEQLAEIQKNLIETVKKNREYYKLKPLSDIENGKSITTSDTDESDDDLPDLDLGVGTKDACVLEVDDVEDMDRINLLIDDRPPDDFHVVNTETIPGLEDLEIVRNLQMFTQISRAKIPAGQLSSMPSKYFARLLQTILFKLRRMVPCALCDLQFKVALPEPDEIQLTVVGMALGLGEPTRMSKYKKKGVNNSSSRDQLKKNEDNDMIFCLDEDHAENGNGADLHLSSASISNSPLAAHSVQKSRPKSPFKNRSHQHKFKHVPLKERYGVDITPLSYLPGGRIERYLGNLNFFFIRESTSIRENGGLSGFTHSFVTEVLAIVRAHITALGGNAMVAFFMTQCVLQHSPHKNQGQCLINVGGDVVSVSYFGDERYNQNC